MISKLQDISIRTMVGQLPTITNYNNDIIEQNFDNIFDSTLNVIKQPVDTTLDNNTGNYIKSHTGTFVNVVTDNAQVNTLKAKKIILDDEIDYTKKHNTLSGRYLTKNNNDEIISINKDSSLGDLIYYTHNAEAIGVKLGSDDNIKSLQEFIDLLVNNDVNYFRQFYNSGSTPSNYGSKSVNEDMYFQEPKSFSFENNVLFANSVQLKRMNLPNYQLVDIKSGNLYTYFEYSPVIKITDEKTVSISGTPGQTVKILFNDLSKKAYYRIILSRKDKKTLRISKDELVRLNLICISNDDIYGTIWDVDNYSVRHPEDLIIEK